jgi:hypothetical protein
MVLVSECEPGIFLPIRHGDAGTYEGGMRSHPFFSLRPDFWCDLDADDNRRDLARAN